MKHFIVLLMFILVFQLSACSDSDKQTHPMDVMSFNVRINLPSDGDYAWPNRKEMAASMIRFYEPDLFGVQEALQGQVNDLSERLPEYDWLGVGRDDGRETGEYMAIFYLKDRFKHLNGNTFWLSEHPETPGLGWDAAYIRVVTWAQFQDQQSGQIFYYFNTHFDNRGELARQESARLLLSKIPSIAGEAPFIVTGDFNSYPDSETYKILTASPLLTDTKAISLHLHHGPTRTFNGFDLESLKSTEQPIDHIFASKDVKVLKHATLADSFDGYFPSDHFPVFTRIIIE